MDTSFLEQPNRLHVYAMLLGEDTGREGIRRVIHLDRNRGLTRREVLAGAGAMSVSLGVVTLSSRSAEAAIEWDQDTDILVVGTGAAGCAAAVAAHQNGDRTLVVEKAPMTGGTALKSAGVLWVPNNFTLKERGIEDSKEDCMRYMVRFSYPQRFDAGTKLGHRHSVVVLSDDIDDSPYNAVDTIIKVLVRPVGTTRAIPTGTRSTNLLQSVAAVTPIADHQHC